MAAGAWRTEADRSSSRSPLKLVTKSGPPDAAAIAKLRPRFDTEQVSALQAT
jgi:hypothetical protein